MLPQISRNWITAPAPAAGLSASRGLWIARPTPAAPSRGTSSAPTTSPPASTTAPASSLRVNRRARYGAGRPCCHCRLVCPAAIRHRVDATLGLFPTMCLEAQLLRLLDLHLVDIVVESRRGSSLSRSTRLKFGLNYDCLLYTSPSPRDATLSRMPSSA